MSDGPPKLDNRKKIVGGWVLTMAGVFVLFIVLLNTFPLGETKSVSATPTQSSPALPQPQYTAKELDDYIAKFVEVRLEYHVGHHTNAFQQMVRYCQDQGIPIQNNLGPTELIASGTITNKGDRTIVRMNFEFQLYGINGQLISKTPYMNLSFMTKNFPENAKEIQAVLHEPLLPGQTAPIESVVHANSESICVGNDVSTISIKYVVAGLELR